MEELPNNIVCEQELLSGLLNCTDAMAEVAGVIKSDDFYMEAHKIIFKVLTKLYEKGKEINLTQIIDTAGREELKKAGGVSYLTQLMMNEVQFTLKEHVKILKDKSRRRMAIKRFKKAVRDFSDEKKDVNETLDKVMESLLDEGKAASERRKTAALNDDELIKNTLKILEDKMNSEGDIPGMSTGFMSMDRTLGGLFKGELDIIAGRPSMGKTLYALNVADGLGKNGFKTLLCELEMNDECIGVRRLSSLSKVEAEKMKFGNLNEDEMQKLLVAADEIEKRNNMYTDCSPCQNVYSIAKEAKKLKASSGLDLIIIDHLNLMETGSGETRDIAIGEVTRNLKRMAKEIDVCVILLCQLSRAVEQRKDKRPMLSDLRESGNLEQDADMVMFLYRDEYYNKYSNEKGILECIIGKQRSGRIGTIKMAYDERCQSIYDI